MQIAIEPLGVGRGQGVLQSARPRHAPCPEMGSTQGVGGVMGGKEEESWLSSVISQVDRLALTIGGYEDEPTGWQIVCLAGLNSQVCKFSAE